MRKSYTLLRSHLQIKQKINEILFYKLSSILLVALVSAILWPSSGGRIRSFNWCKLLSLDSNNSLSFWTYLQEHIPQNSRQHDIIAKLGGWNGGWLSLKALLLTDVLTLRSWHPIKTPDIMSSYLLQMMSDKK